MFSLLESVAFDMGYSGPNGLVQQSWENGNGTSYIYFGAGEFDGQGSGHDYFGTVSFSLHVTPADVLYIYVLSMLTCCLLQLYMPSSGFINNCDGGRSHTYCDYRQQ